MKKLEFATSKGEFILEEASDKNLGGVLVKHMTEEQFAEVVDSTVKGVILTCFKDYTKGYYSNSVFTAKESFQSLIKSLGWNLFENPYQTAWDELCIWGHGGFAKDGKSEFQLYTEAESKTLYNPIILKKI